MTFRKSVDARTCCIEKVFYFSFIFRFMIGHYVTVHGDVIAHVNISHVMVEDGGEYSCIAENRAGKTSHSARLNIYGKGLRLNSNNLRKGSNIRAC